jgi:hypothetical protein
MNETSWELLRLPLVGPEAPHIVIDDRGLEVGAIVHYAEYVVLLDLLDRHVGRERLPDYWRNAMGGCFALS